MELSSLGAPEVVKMVTSSAAGDDNIIKCQHICFIDFYSDFILVLTLSLSLIWINFNRSKISINTHHLMWGEILIHSNISTAHLWSLGMDKWFHPKLYWTCDYLSMLGLELNHISKSYVQRLFMWFCPDGECLIRKDSYQFIILYDCAKMLQNCCFVSMLVS